MLPPISEMQEIRVFIFGANKERTEFDVLIEVDKDRYTQGILQILEFYAPIPKHT